MFLENWTLSWNVWKISGQSEDFLDGLETFQKLSGNFLENWTLSWHVWKFSSQSENFLDGCENFRTIWNFPGSQGTFLTV